MEIENNMIVAAQQYAIDKCRNNMSALTIVKVAWESGFKAAQEHMYSVSDMHKAYIEGTNEGAQYNDLIHNDDKEALQKFDKQPNKRFKKFIKSIKQSKKEHS